MSANLRIHIAPVGFEFLRVTDPLTKMHADKVYLITRAEDDAAAKFFSQIKKKLRQDYKHIEVKEVFLNIWNLYDCIEKFREIIFKEKGNHVYINVSTGTKITAIAGMLSCMLWRASPYYAPVSYPTKEIKTLTTELVQNSDPLPVYDIKKPKSEFMLILSLLQSNGGTMRKSKIIDEMVELKILRKMNESGNELKGPAMHSQLRALLDPMESEWNYVKVKASGRRSEVSITEQGKTALQIFGCENTTETDTS